MFSALNYFTFVISISLTVISFCSGAEDSTPAPKKLVITVPTFDDIEQFLNLDEYGTYSTQHFPYESFQYRFYDDKWLVKKTGMDGGPVVEQRCAAQFVKCIANLEMPHLVCGFTHNDYYKFYESYCHLYFDNCVRYHRHRRLVFNGGCVLSMWKNYQNVDTTLRDRNPWAERYKPRVDKF